MQELPHALPLVQMRQHLIGGVHDNATGDSGSSSFAAAPNARKSDAAEIAATRVFLRANERPVIELSVRFAEARRYSAAWLPRSAVTTLRATPKSLPRR